MIVEIGHFTLASALIVAIFQSIFGLYGAHINNVRVFALCKNSSIAHAFLLTCSFFILIYSYIISDFSVLNVALNSHTNKPFLYRLSGTWGNHEGSLLLWICILSIYSLAVTFFTTYLPYRLVSRVLGVLGIISTGFISFTIFTSNPFVRLFPAALEGNGLNPVLQDPGLAFHPPLLYCGYVGLSVPFAFAIAALISGKVSSSWARWVRPWVLISWIFLTLGITLGSWWAYYELGWGGWWFWDPVENVSFLPWLLSTALLHSARVSEKRDALKSWTILLSIIAFALSLLGTFIVRSGLLTSVHAFASDPARGIYILSFLFIIISGAFILFSMRYGTLKSTGTFSPLSRESALLLNNVFFCSSAATIMLGTLWPIFIEISLNKSVSVGPPYYEMIFLPLMLPAAFLSGLSPMLTWKKANLESIIERIWMVVILCIVICLMVFWIYGGSLLSIIGVGTAFWLLSSIFVDWSYRVRVFDASLTSVLRRSKSLPMSIYGMFLAHLGVAIFILGATVSSSWEKHYEGLLIKDQILKVAHYEINLTKVTNGAYNNWVAERGVFSIKDRNKKFEMIAERRVYKDTGMPSTEAGIHSSFFSHLYIVLGAEQPIGSGSRVVRVYYNPLVSLIWIGAIIMALGGFVALIDKKLRYKKSNLIIR